MLPFGHSSTGYLIGKIGTKGRSLNWSEIVFLVFCANCLDFDFLFTQLVGLPVGFHHYLPTHTPLAALLVWFGLYFVLRKTFSRRILILGGVAIGEIIRIYFVQRPLLFVLEISLSLVAGLTLLFDQTTKRARKNKV